MDKIIVHMYIYPSLFPVRERWINDDHADDCLNFWILNSTPVAQCVLSMCMIPCDIIILPNCGLEHACA